MAEVKYVKPNIIEISWYKEIEGLRYHDIVLWLRLDNVGSMLDSMISANVNSDGSVEIQLRCRIPRDAFMKYLQIRRKYRKVDIVSELDMLKEILELLPLE